MFYIDHSINCVCRHSLLRVLNPHSPPIPLPNLRPRRKARIQQNCPITLPSRYSQELGARIYSRCTIFGRFPIRIQTGRRSFLFLVWWDSCCHSNYAPAPVLNHSLQNSISRSSIYTRSMDRNGVRTVMLTSSACLGFVVFFHHNLL